jgi:hypothetical protein
MLRLSHILTTAALLAVCATPASAVTFEDLHSNGSSATVDVPPPPSSIAASAAEDYRDLRSPDARDAATSVDLRSPDARDAARDVPPVQLPTPVIEVKGNPSSGFDWGDAGIGAAGMFALFGIVGGVALLLTARRRRQQVRVAH